MNCALKPQSHDTSHDHQPLAQCVLHSRPCRACWLRRGTRRQNSHTYGETGPQLYENRGHTAAQAGQSRAQTAGGRIDGVGRRLAEARRCTQFRRTCLEVCEKRSSRLTLSIDLESRRVRLGVVGYSRAD